MYDVLIVGGGVVGCAIARNLSKYKLKIVVVEKENDVCEGTSCANSAIVHSGYDPEPGTLKAKLNVLGNSLYPQLCKELDVPFRQDGSLTIACDDEEMKKLDALALRSKENGVPCEIIDAKRLQEMEPNLNKSIKGALFAPTCGIVNPFELTVALMENAMDNGAELKLNSKVIAIDASQDVIKVTLENGEVIETKVLINSAGVYSDEINKMINPNPEYEVNPRKGEYFVLDHFDNNFLKHTIFMLPSDKGKGVLVSPTTSDNFIIGPSSDFVNDKDDVSTNKDILDYVRVQASRIIEKMPYNHLIREFSGLRAVSNINHGDFIIEQSSVSKNIINCAGIQSPGLASTPAIALKVTELVGSVLELVENPNFNPTRRPVVRFKYLTAEEKNKVIKENPLYGHIVCRCEKISEAEIIDCINRNCGATTVKGVKKRCRPGFGRCQGAMCEPQVIAIIARELGLKRENINYGAKDTIVCKYETKVGDLHD